MDPVSEEKILGRLSTGKWMTFEEILQFLYSQEQPKEKPLLAITFSFLSADSKRKFMLWQSTKKARSLNLILNKLIAEWHVIAEFCPISKWKFKGDT